MAYIRDRSEERTGYQCSAGLYGKIDFGCDFVMVYRCNETTAERVESYRKMGYRVHLMTGIAWGGYQDYLAGKTDGREHYDESQTDRFGNQILHGVNTPYMVPTIAFADYITEKLKAAVDAGVEAIHVEEPEFWDRAGYSPAFKREYELYYRQPWSPPHESVDACYKAAKLKAFLYRRTIERVSSALKEYALTKHNRILRFYVPTHSLLNYTQWKIVSPEGQLADIPSVDGCIAQVWTGTSREKNWFDGVFAERTFETAFLEYGIMQELVNSTGKKMWFLHDPIEDNPQYDWDDYRRNYLETLIASLLHPKINSYEICPWPNRVFDASYPSGSPDAVPIPPAYCSLLNGVFQTLGDIETAQPSQNLNVGVLMSDAALYQRTFPDKYTCVAASEEVGTVLHQDEKECEEFRTKLFAGKETDAALMNRFEESNALPMFFGLAMPLLKYGLAVRPALLDNVRRYSGCLDSFDVLVLSYEFMKPDYPDINAALASWVRNGGQLIYIGDGSDPFHSISSWWSGKYSNPAEHLFEMLGVEPINGRNIYSVGSGTFAVWETNPARFCFSKENADEYRSFFKEVIGKKGRGWRFANHLIQPRGAYIAAAVLDESVNDEPLVLKGLFADMLTPDFALTTEKTILPGENGLLFDLNKIEEELRIVGTSVRVLSLSSESRKICMTLHGASNLNAFIRLRTPFQVTSAEADNGTEVSCRYDEESRTALLGFESRGEDITVTLS